MPQFLAPLLGAIGTAATTGGAAALTAASTIGTGLTGAAAGLASGLGLGAGAGAASAGAGSTLAGATTAAGAASAASAAGTGAGVGAGLQAGLAQGIAGGAGEAISAAQAAELVAASGQTTTGALLGAPSPGAAGPMLPSGQASTSIVGAGPGGAVTTFTPAGEVAFDAGTTAGEGAASAGKLFELLSQLGGGGGGAQGVPSQANQISSKIGGDDNEELLALLGQLLQQRGN